MKLLGHTVSRKGDKLTIEADWRDRQRQPAGVQLVKTSGQPGDRALWRGELRDGTKMMFALAEIAWGMGWRPGGLVESINALVVTHKVPKAEG